MSDEQNNQPITPELQKIIHDRWLGSMNAEFGALQNSYFMEKAKADVLAFQRTQDLVLIEGLRTRVLNAEANMRILQDQYAEQRAEIERLTKLNNKREKLKLQKRTS